VVVYNRLNTSGASNGILKVWIDDQLVLNYSNAVYTSGSDANKPVDTFAFDPIYTGNNDDKKPAADYLYFDFVRFSTTEFSDSGSGGTPPPATNLTPMAPSNITIQ